ncbi:hypothetical protein K2X14_10565 [Acetobacter sp. TBRC 12305]|uniref:hypothetical protein n=1 Tax=Acetobacter garciniae TaxID=2817435 RepID=UPI001C73A1B3|nr:hypothetical protein [Acetobacter garciniae]MBX0345277.1 hypothetical protein [Acetobacter garciniae]
MIMMVVEVVAAFEENGIRRMGYFSQRKSFFSIQWPFPHGPYLYGLSERRTMLGDGHINLRFSQTNDAEL